MDNADLTPHDVSMMPLTEFEARFGFRPADALEKKWFAVMGKRLTPVTRRIMQNVPDDLTEVVMV